MAAFPLLAYQLEGWFRNLTTGAGGIGSRPATAIAPGSPPPHAPGRFRCHTEPLAELPPTLVLDHAGVQERVACRARAAPLA